MTRFLVGCYTDGDGGEGVGLTVATHAPESGAWTVEHPAVGGVVASPTYLVAGPDGLALAISEVPDGAVVAVSLAEDVAPEVVSTGSTGGEFPCHLAVDPSGRWVISANYGSGSLSVHALTADGIGERAALIEHTGSGPNADRQAGPHVHMIHFLSDTLLLTVDLGIDAIVAYRLDGETGVLTEVQRSAMPAGFGPRHVVSLPGDRLAIAGELSGEIALAAIDPASGAVTVLDRHPASAAGEQYGPSAILATSDGRFVLIANRGPDTVSSWRVDDDRLHPVAEISTGGANPRDMTLVGDLLYVANQDDHTVTVFEVDPSTGALSRREEVLSLPSPTRLLPL